MHRYSKAARNDSSHAEVAAAVAQPAAAVAQPAATTHPAAAANPNLFAHFAQDVDALIFDKDGLENHSWAINQPEPPEREDDCQPPSETFEVSQTTQKQS